jgi:hypothetical protein
VICLDEMGPVSAKSYAGRALVQTKTRPAERAKQEIDDGRRAKGYIFGTFSPATGEAFIHPYPGRGAPWVDFLDHVERWIPSTTRRVSAITDNLSSHRTTDVLLFLLAHPCWEMVFQPKYAAYLNLIEPWWKILRSLALAGQRFESWDEISEAIHRSTLYWNAHRHPLSGANTAGIGHGALPALPSCRGRHDLPDEPLNRIRSFGTFNARKIQAVQQSSGLALAPYRATRRVNC